MISSRWGFLAVLALLFVPFVAYAQISAGFHPGASALALQPTPTGRIASAEELAAAQAAWEQSAHADTYDNGQGANTTCARCKSPTNWDMSQDAAAQEALNCNSCKRVPGAPRPELPSGVVVPQDEWHNITCDICHIPTGDSYYTGIVFWNQALGQYEPVESEAELCSHCHEGRHGFEVVEEQQSSMIHGAWDCSTCHGAHGASAACTDCHNPESGPGSPEHGRHPSVNCTGCHDAGDLSVWYDTDQQSPHYGEYVPLRFAHTLTSWPSHNLTRSVDCKRCHHPQGLEMTAVVPTIRCDACHQHEDGAVWIWCTYFKRNPEPIIETGSEP